jgi:two-component system, response regulator PdtaR
MMMKNKLKILIVEDEVLTAMLICDNLSNYGYMVCKPAATGEVAIRKVEEEKPDIVFMDIRLAGGMDGIETAEIITSRFNIPVVFMTGYSTDDVLERAKKIKPLGFLSKPLILEEMKDIINKFIKE